MGEYSVRKNAGIPRVEKYEEYTMEERAYTLYRTA